MNPKGLRGLATGILLTTIVCGAIYFFDQESEVERPQAHVDISVDEMINRLEKEGYNVVLQNETPTAEEIIPLEPIETDTEEIEASEDLPNNVSVETVTVYTMILNISRGMTSTTVAEQLVRGRIIESKQDFLDYMQTKNRSRSIRVGNYEIRSDMSLAEIAEIIS